MAKNQIISLWFQNMEIGRIGFDENLKKASFQYSPQYLESGKYKKLFPYLFKRTPSVQIFSIFNNETFRGLPPMISDSLPDSFGNLVFKEWLEESNKDIVSLSPLELLTYVGKRGMGAIEYKPAKEFSNSTTIDLNNITEIVRKVVDRKMDTQEQGLSDASLLNIFKIGTSAGGARPKIIVSEQKHTGVLVPGDLVVSEDYNHWLIKLSLDKNRPYSQEQLEFIYYKIATSLGIDMMQSKLIEDRHFATLRFDRQHGEKQHILTATGMTGWDYRNPDPSNYENLFKLSTALQVPHRDIIQLFRRMAFNLVFGNTDDHLKNFSFIYNHQSDKWNLSPAYDLTYPFDALLNITKINRALSLNGKRHNIVKQDLLEIAEKYSIKGARGIIDATVHTTHDFKSWAEKFHFPKEVVEKIMSQFQLFEEVERKHRKLRR